MSLKFGTDGVRGVANTELTPELVLTLGRAAARVLGGRQWVIGRDTRRSGTLLAGALAAGLASEGIDVVDLGVLPTPGVAHVSAVDGVASLTLAGGAAAVASGATAGRPASVPGFAGVGPAALGRRPFAAAERSVPGMVSSSGRR